MEGPSIETALHMAHCSGHYRGIVCLLGGDTVKVFGGGLLRVGEMEGRWDGSSLAWDGQETGACFDGLRCVCGEHVVGLPDWGVRLADDGCQVWLHTVRMEQGCLPGPDGKSVATVYGMVSPALVVLLCLDRGLALAAEARVTTPDASPTTEADLDAPPRPLPTAAGPPPS